MSDCVSLFLKLPTPYFTPTFDKLETAFEGAAVRGEDNGILIKGVKGRLPALHDRLSTAMGVELVCEQVAPNAFEFSIK